MAWLSTWLRFSSSRADSSPAASVLTLYRPFGQLYTQRSEFGYTRGYFWSARPTSNAGSASSLTSPRRSASSAGDDTALSASSQRRRWRRQRGAESSSFPSRRWTAQVGIAALPNVAAVEQILISAARHSAKPAPTQGPLTAAITGCGMSRIGLRKRGHPLLEAQAVDCGRRCLRYVRAENRACRCRSKTRVPPRLSDSLDRNACSTRRAARVWVTSPCELADHDVVDCVEPLGSVELQHHHGRRCGRLLRSLPR